MQNKFHGAWYEHIQQVRSYFVGGIFKSEDGKKIRYCFNQQILIFK